MARAGPGAVTFPAPAWHALLAPLPGDAVPERRSVSSPQVLAGRRRADAPQWDSTRKDPSPGDVEALRGLVADLRRRQPGP
jgi:hypothetical protein